MSDMPYATQIKYHKQHFWKIRNKGFRELLIKHGWYFHGGYASKMIEGKTVMQTIVEKHPDYILCCFQFKVDFWKAIRNHHAEKKRRTDNKIQEDAQKESRTNSGKKCFPVVKKDSFCKTDSSTTVSRHR